MLYNCKDLGLFPQIRNNQLCGNSLNSLGQRISTWLINRTKFFFGKVDYLDVDYLDTVEYKKNIFSFFLFMCVKQKCH